MGSRRCHLVCLRKLGPCSKGLPGNAASSIPFSLPSSAVFPNSRGQLQHQGMQKLCSCSTRSDLVTSQECQLGKIPTNENKSWIGEALWITGGFFNLLPVVVSKLAIHSTTQEAPKTQQISQSPCPIRCKPNKLTAFLQGTRTVHIYPRGVISLPSLKPLPSIPAGPRAAQLS